jgi:hypothetical protein
MILSEEEEEKHRWASYDVALSESLRQQRRAATSAAASTPASSYIGATIPVVAMANTVVHPP